MNLKKIILWTIQWSTIQWSTKQVLMNMITILAHHLFPITHIVNMLTWQNVIYVHVHVHVFNTPKPDVQY